MRKSICECYHVGNRLLSWMRLMISWATSRPWKQEIAKECERIRWLLGSYALAIFGYTMMWKKSPIPPSTSWLLESSNAIEYESEEG